MHSHQSHQHHLDQDWAARVADITREGEVLMPYLTETVSWLADICRRDGLEVRRIVDIGSGPGVGTCVLAQQFESAVVLAVDGTREMLEAAAARAEALGLSDRVRTQLADLPADLDQLSAADIVWAAMVLHHVEDVAAALRGIRTLLQPGGMLAIVEFGDPPRFLPDDVGAGRPGLTERIGGVNMMGLASRVDYWPMLEAAGFERVAERMARVHLDPPLSEDARRVALRYLGRIRQFVEDQLDAEDRETLDVLMDEEAPFGIMRREDVFLDISRLIYVARVKD